MLHDTFLRLLLIEILIYELIFILMVSIDEYGYEIEVIILQLVDIIEL